MEPTRQRKIWRVPELIILARSNPEESVLDICKGGAFAGPASGFAICSDVLPGCTGCAGAADS